MMIWRFDRELFYKNNKHFIVEIRVFFYKYYYIWSGCWKSLGRVNPNEYKKKLNVFQIYNLCEESF